MKKNLCLFLILFIISIVINSCKKDFDNDFDSDISLTDTSWAKQHYRTLIKLKGRAVKDKFSFAVSGVELTPNYKHTIWKKARYTENKQVKLVEIPMLYNRRSAGVITKSKLSFREEQEVYRGTFDRLLIYKDKVSGRMGQKIVTYIPDLNYLRSKKNDVSHNQINKLDKDFSGYLTFREWDGKLLSIMEVTNGKLVRKTILNKKSKKKKKGSSVSTLYVCGTITITEWQDVVTTSTDPETNMIVVTVESSPIGSHDEDFYCEDGLTGDDCIDFGIDCGPYLTGDDCIDYGIGCDYDPGPDPYVLYVDKINDANLNPCMRGVAKTLFTNTTGNTASAMQTFIGSSPTHNWILNSSPLSATTNALTGWDPNGSGNIVTRIDPSKFVNATEVAVARTILHESIHGYLLVYPRNPNNPHSTYQVMFDEFIKSQDLNQAHHQQIAEAFIGNIAFTLRGMFPNLTTDPNYFNDMAWGGLTGKTYFQALPSATQSRINDRLSVEQNGFDRNGNAQPQVGSPAGC